MAVRRALPLKKITFVLLVLALAVLMVLPAISGVNQSANVLAGTKNSLRADGSPMPLSIPQPAPDTYTTTGKTLIADGAPVPVPLPPPGLWTNTDKSFVADGAPVPVPLPPPGLWTNTDESLVADGAPVPVPLPPQSFVV
jgi:hypothetical protein